MKTLIALPLVIAGVTAELSLESMEGTVRRRGGHECSEHTTCESCAGEDDCHFNLRVGRCVDKSGRNSGDKWAKTEDDCPDTPPKFRLTFGATCPDGYEALTSSWEDCVRAARALGFKGDAVENTQYNKPWGTGRPQGCFRNGKGEFHFNDGEGGNAKGKDRILCVLKGEGNRIRQVGSSVESDGVLGGLFETSAPEGNAPTVPGLGDEGNGGMAQHEFGSVPDTITHTIESENAFKFFDKEEGWMKEEPVGRTVCGADGRKRIHGTTSAPWKWIVDLEMTTKTNKKYICTGFFISKRAIMTAGHCLYMADEGGWVKHVKVCPGRNGSSYPYGCAWANWMWTTNNWVNHRSMEYDYATMTLPDNSMYDKGVGYFGFTSDFSNVYGVNVAGYPGDKDGGTTQWWNYESYTLKSRMIDYMADTAGGMSGGPAWAYYSSENQRRVVGIHAYGGCPNSAVRVTSDVFDWMMDFRKNYN